MQVIISEFIYDELYKAERKILAHAGGNKVVFCWSFSVYFKVAF